MWFGHTSCPVVGPILGVDHHQNALGEPGFLLAEDVGEVGPLLSTAVHGRIKVHPVSSSVQLTSSTLPLRVLGKVSCN